MQHNGAHSSTKPVQKKRKQRGAPGKEAFDKMAPIPASSRPVKSMSESGAPGNIIVGKMVLFTAPMRSRKKNNQQGGTHPSTKMLLRKAVTPELVHKELARMHARVLFTDNEVLLCQEPQNSSISCTNVSGWGTGRS
jgi:hypothetical protein